jgi:hypothetical protein
MKFTSKTTQSKEILANDHYVAIAYDCSSLATDNGIVKAGTIVPANDATAIGVLLYDVMPAVNPNGAVVIHGFIKKNSLPVAPADTVAISQVTFI